MKRASLVIMLLLCVGSLAQEGQRGNQSEPISLETFEGPRPLPVKDFYFPESERNRGNDGWVNLSMMISPEGKPFEIIVTESSGNAVLEAASIKQAQKWRFTPAKLNGQPIESAHEMKTTYRVSNSRISKGFSVAYDGFTKSLDMMSKDEAISRLGELKPKNLFEDTFFGLANYYFAAKWDTEATQLYWIKRAIAKEKTAIYMTDETFLLALRTQFRLQAKLLDLQGAIDTWNLIKGLTKDPSVLDPLGPTVAQIESLRADSRAYSVNGTIGSESWELGLLKRHFSINVAEGQISQIKLRCEKKYIYFDYNPELQYNVAASAGQCSIQLVGDPGTRFELIQS